MGQPSKLTPERQDRMEQLLRAGNRLMTACDEAGITHRTHRNWMIRGETEHERLTTTPNARPRKTEAPYLQYFQTIKRATALPEITNIALIQRAARGGTQTDTQTIETFYPDGSVKTRKVITKLEQPQWTAAAWWLERRMPHEYGRRDTMKIEMEVEAQLNELFKDLRHHLSPAALQEFQTYLTSRTSERPEQSEPN